MEPSKSPGSNAAGSVVPRSEQGSVIVQMVYTIGLFFFLIISSFDFLKVVFTQNLCEIAASEVLRSVVISGGSPLGTSGNRGRDIADLVRAGLSAYGVQVPRNAVTVCPLGTTRGVCDKNTAPAAGNSGELIGIRIDYPVPLIFSSVKYPLTVSVIGRNEPF